MTPYYDDGTCVIYHGDCQEIMESLDAVDLIVTSPPYNLGVSSGGGVKGSTLWKNNALKHGYGAHDDAMEPLAYATWQRSVLRSMWETLTSDGAIFYNHKPRQQSGLLFTPLDLNPSLPVRQIVIWARSSGFNFTTTAFCPTHEWIVVFAKEAFRLSACGSRMGDVWHVLPAQTDDHPAPFPLQIPLNALNATTARTVLDPFMGSGTTLRAAKDLGRKAIGIEIEERYCEIAAKRLGQEVLDLGGVA